MSAAGVVALRRPRERYSRLICLGCSERRIRCELPIDVQSPGPGELRTTQTPCYRCKRLDIPCVIRQTILGRPRDGQNAIATTDDRRRVGASSAAPHVIVDLLPEVDRQPLTRSAVLSRPARELRSVQGDSLHSNGGTLLLRRPQSGEPLIIINALETLRSESVQEQWFRHLPSRFGHSKALDLAVKALVVACAYSRGAPKLTASDCRQALALALAAVQADLTISRGRPDDLVLAAIALFAPFEGVVGKNRVPTRVHINGLAAMLVARPADYPVSQLARDILDFQAIQSGVRACLRDSPSPFEHVAPAFYASADGDGDAARLKALGTGVFLRIPRLVMLVRSLRTQRFPQSRTLLDVLRLSGSLLRLQDPPSEERLIRSVKISKSGDFCGVSAPYKSLQFDSAGVFEALSYYWQARLSLLNLVRSLYNLQELGNACCFELDVPEMSARPQYGPGTNEACLLAKNLLMCSEYAGKLRLLKHRRLFAHAMVVAWGAYMEDGQFQRGLSSLILQGINRALRAEPPLTVEDMDIAADIFVGGPCKGRFAELFGL